MLLINCCPKEMGNANTSQETGRKNAQLKRGKVGML